MRVFRKGGVSNFYFDIYDSERYSGAVNSNFSPLDNEWKISVRFMASGVIKTKPLISHRIKLEDIAGTFKSMYEQKMIYNKIIFSP